nr:MAG TPA: hypothetical protein [Caudoviricetes sp.]
MKVLGLIEQDLDIVSKEYVDNKVKEISKADDVAPEGYMKVDLLSLWAVYGLNEGIHNRVSDALGFSKLLQKCITKEKTHLISPDIDVEKQVITPPELLDIVKSNRICYISERDYLEGVCYYFERIRAGVKLNILVPILWAALKGKGEGHTKKEQIYEDIFELLKNFIAGDGKTPIGDLKDHSGEPLSKDEVGLFQLIEESPDIYANSMYLSTGLDNVIDAILSSSSGGAENPNLKERVGLDLISLIMFLPSEEQCKAMGTTREEIANMFLESAVDSEGISIRSKHEYTTLTIEKLSEIAKTDQVVYVDRSIFLSLIADIENMTTSTTENPQLKDYIKVNIPTLYMIYSLIKSSLPKNAHLDVTPDDWVLATLSLSVDKDKKDIKPEGKTILELSNTVREAYILKSQFDDLITSAIREDFTPIGKRKGYELMKTHYAIYLCSLAHRVKNSRLGQNQQFFKLIKDGYSINEYDERKTLVNDLGFTYDESAPESSYDIDALSNFTNKHPEVYVPTEFTDYVKGTAEATMDMFGAVTNMMKFYEAHEHDPKIKIVTPNEYKINSKDPNTLYIVKES